MLVEHAFRIITLVCVLLSCLWLPAALSGRIKTQRMWLILVALELQLIGAAVVVVGAWNGPVVWYRGPRILLSALLVLWYCWLARRDRTRRGA